MATLEAQHLLELTILDYLSKRGFHQTGETFSNEIRANQNLVAINSLHEAFLQAWWDKFYKAYNSRFPDVPVFAVESFDKVAQIVENIVGNNNPENQSYAPDLTGASISNVMPESSGPDLMDAMVSTLLSSFDAGYELPDLSPQRDMTSGLHFPEMSEMGGVLPFASNSGLTYRAQTWEDLCKWNHIFMPLQMLCLIYQNFLMQAATDISNKHLIMDGHLFGNKFQLCTFHPGHTQVLVIGSFEFLELWNPILHNSTTRSYSARAGIISSLADSPSKGTIASVSHDQWIKIWR
ncbi:hypothetical protein HAX54_047427 [Datura stramonium]|uniref:LisH domain-containing protein n=1 Tax=Datura stramonium TaxID=4076 RepID=A0ABS8SU83_DATST|nr:hypothetical protein [Datura stramonium]